MLFFGVDCSSSLHIVNKKKDILVLGKGPTQGLDDIIIIREAKYSIKDQEEKFVCIIMKTIVFYLVIPQKYINSKQITLK